MNNKCKWCDKETGGKIIWYIPENHEYISACDDCVDINIEEIPAINPYIITGHLK